MPAPCTPWLTEPQAPGVTLELGGPQASALLPAWERAGWYLLFTLAGFPLQWWADKPCLLKMGGGTSHYGLVGLYKGQVVCLNN